MVAWLVNPAKTRIRQGFSLPRGKRGALHRSCRPLLSFVEGSAYVGGLTCAIGVAGKIILAEGGGDLGRGPAPSTGGYAESHIRDGWLAGVAGRRAEARKLDRTGYEYWSGSKAQASGGPLLLDFLLDGVKLQAERLCGGEGLAEVTDKTRERVEAMGVAVLWLSVGEAWCSSEPAPVGGADVSAKLLGKRVRGQGSEFFRKRLRVA